MLSTPLAKCIGFVNILDRENYARLRRPRVSISFIQMLSLERGAMIKVVAHSDGGLGT